MNTRLTTPTSRLICFGGARASTNAQGGDTPEFDNGPLYEG
ncbi:MAG: hypothetical protein Q8M76_18675 [Spirochaetaceae bacterium]|nr:hypothetical protein [Spirochaetaceae bacterium]